MPSRSRSSRLAMGSASCPNLAAASAYPPLSARATAPLATAPTAPPKRKRSKAGRRPVKGVCANCRCTEHETGQWREDRSASFGPGAKLCSACGLYFNVHRKHRPRELWSRGQRSSPSTSGRASRQVSGQSSATSIGSSNYLEVPTVLNSPTSYLSPAPSPPPYTPYTHRQPSAPRLKLTVGKRTKLCVPASREYLSPTSDEELTIVLGSKEERQEVVESEQKRAGEGGAIEGLLALGDQKVYQPSLLPTPAPSRPTSTTPAPYPIFRLLDTRPAFMYNHAPRQASPLLPWPVPSPAGARALAQPAHERVNLPPMRGVANPSRRLPHMRELWLA